MAANWNAEMRERFDTLEHKVDTLTGKVDTLAGKVGTLEGTVGTLESKVSTLGSSVDKLAMRVGGVEKTVGTLGDEVKNLRCDLRATEERLENQFKVTFESMRELVQKATEGYGATLDGIYREISEMRREWHGKWDDHDRVLRNHADR